MVLVAEEVVKVESELFHDLKKILGNNFSLFVDTVRLREWKKKGPYIPPEAKLGTKKNALAFPPLTTKWSLRRTEDVVKDTGKPIRINEQTIEMLSGTLGQKKVDLLRQIGFDERPNRDSNVKEREIKVFQAAWGESAYPDYQLNGTWAKRLPPTSDDTSEVHTHLDTTKFKAGPDTPHASKVKGNFYW